MERFLYREVNSVGAIVDIIHVGEEELNTLRNAYQDVKILKMSDTHHIIQRYRIIIPNEEESDYYFFLLQNCMAMSSTNFVNRMQSDMQFAETMKLRSKEIVEDYLANSLWKVSV